MVPMREAVRTRRRLEWGAALALVLCVQGAWPGGLAVAQNVPEVQTAESAGQDNAATPFAAQLAAAQQQLKNRGAILEQEIRGVTDSLNAVDAQLRKGQTPELRASFDDLNDRREALRSELGQLQSLVGVYQDANDVAARAESDAAELRNFRDALTHGEIKFRAGEIAVLEAKIRQLFSVQRSLQGQEAGRNRRLQEIEGELKRADAKRQGTLEQERNVLLAYQETEGGRRSAMEARLNLLQAELEAAQRLSHMPVSRPATQSAPSTEVAAIETANKRKLANELALDARDRLGYDRQQWTETERQLEQARRKGEDTDALEESLQYWTEMEEYETRCLRQAALKKQEAQLDQRIAELGSAHPAGYGGDRECSGRPGGLYRPEAADAGGGVPVGRRCGHQRGRAIEW